ncbi:7970_t:CDS:1, partial [Gigaspora margarita]
IIISRPNTKSCIASSKICNKANIFVANSKDINNLEENIDFGRLGVIWNNT